MSANGTQEKLLASIGDKVAAVITPMMVAIAMLDTKLEAITFRLDTFDEMMGPKCKTDTLEKKQVADGGDAPVTSAPARARSKKAATPAAVPAAGLYSPLHRRQFPSVPGYARPYAIRRQAGTMLHRLVF